MDNFADEPISIADLRSEKSNKARDWSPRDMLIKLLRQIDRGELAPEAMIVMYYTIGKNGGPIPTYTAAGGKGPMDLMGLASCGAAKVRQDGPE